MNNKRWINTQTLVRVSILAVIAFILMFIRMPLPFAPNFMDIDISEMPALIASFSMGPMAGFLVVLLKLVLKTVFQGTTTAYVGELSNLIVSSIMVVSAGLIYKRKKTMKMAVLSLIIGILCMSLAATLSNYFVIFPMYAGVMGIELDAFADTVSEINPYVSDFKSLMIFAVLPFNIVKGLLTSVFTFFLYKRVGRFIKG